MKLVVVVLAALTAAAVAAVVVRPAAGSAFAGELAVTLPRTVVAGTPVRAEVVAPAAGDGTRVEAVVVASYRTTVVEGTFQDGAATLPLPTDVTGSAGLVTVITSLGRAEARAHLEVRAGGAVDPVVPLVGARSIVADGRDTAMVVVLPEDEYGNPVRDGTAVTLTVRRPRGEVERVTVPVEHTLAWTWVRSRHDAGATTVTAAIDGARGPAMTLLEVPGPPEPFSLRAGAPTGHDDATRMLVRTTPLTDVHGNVLRDGTAAVFVVERDGETVSLIDEEVIDGRATTLISAPDGTQEVVVRAIVAGAASDRLQIDFRSQRRTGEVPLEVTWDNGTLVADVGPVIGALGELISDGEDIRLQADGVAVATGFSVDGRARLIAGVPHRPDRVEVVVAGRRAEVRP